jgi:diphthamide synthase (EF-2-diphthine--ammonia ligase)
MTVRSPDYMIFGKWTEKRSFLMATALAKLKQQGATGSVFGDIFLEDLRKYREERLAEADLRGIFPLWNIPTRALIRDFVDSGFRAITTCVNDRWLDRRFVGRVIDDDFLNDLPPGVDPCGENGEYHSFVFDIDSETDPASQTASGAARPGDTDSPGDPFENGFWYCDLLPR